MAQSGQITLYTHYYSPFGQRVHMALEEAKAEYTEYTVDLINKPVWYSAKVNPAGKIPALTYRGPNTTPEDPSPESAKLAESLVLVEFIADLFPSSSLLPASPVQRARARLFISVLEDKFIPAWVGLIFTGAPSTVLLDAVEALQGRLPPTGFAVGAFSIADVAAAPFFARLLLLLRHEIGRYPLGEGKRTLEALGQPRFARMAQYIDDLNARPSFRVSWDETKVLAMWKMNPVTQRLDMKENIWTS